MDSFAVLKTNPKLTSNVKLVKSEDSLYLESLDTSISEINDDKLKKFLINPKTPFNLSLSKFWKDKQRDLVYQLKDNEDYGNMYEEYSNQIDDDYIYGVKYNNDNRYPEELSFFAPLYVEKNISSENFFIFKVEGSGFIDLNNTNVREEVFDRMKVVDYFDLTPNTKLGELITDYISQPTFPDKTIDLDFRNNEFSYIQSIDLESGGFVSKAKIFSDEFQNEMTFSEGHQLLTQSLEDEGLIYPNILNIDFKFDDELSKLVNPYQFNRYLGFYGKLEKLTNIPIYTPPILKSNLKLSENNTFLLGGVEVDPFVGGFSEDKPHYIEFSGEYYLIRKISEKKFKVITDKKLPTDIDENFNKNFVKISKGNFLERVDGSDLNIEGLQDVNLIKINGEYHRVLKTEGKVKIVSDFEFNTFNNFLDKKLTNRSDDKLSETIDLRPTSEKNPPKEFELFCFEFSDIKNFDQNILQTDFSEFQYDSENKIIDTDEKKFYEKNFKFEGSLKPQEEYIFKNEVKNLPLSSEFLSTSELFEVIDGQTKPNILWRKNQGVVKWGIEKSISNFDYPYMFNNNKNAGEYNRTTDVSLKKPNRSSNNLDYFYNFSPENSDFGLDYEISDQTLSILNSDGFEVKKYFEVDSTGDYFGEVFNYIEDYNNKKRKRKKFSEFLPGDENTPNITNFNGLKFSLYDVDSISLKNDISKNLDKVKVSNSDRFRGFKFSIIIDKLKNEIENDFIDKKTDNIWKPIKKWERDKTYFPDEVVLFEGTKYKSKDGYGFPGYGVSTQSGSVEPNEYTFPNGEIEPFDIDNGTPVEVQPTGPNDGMDTLYRCIATNSVVSPENTLDDNLNSWESYPPDGNNIIFFRPNQQYEKWEPSIEFQSMIEEEDGDLNYKKYVTFYKGNYYKSVKKQKGKSPDFVLVSQVNKKEVLLWEEIKEFKQTKNYLTNELVSLNGDLYYFEKNSSELKLLHTFRVEENNEISSYKIIKDSGVYYISPQRDSVFEDGINIYINKDHKNVLVHIYTNNNLIDLSKNRDEYYKNNLFKFTANNFISYINNPTEKSNLTGFVNYFIVENKKIKKFSRDNIEGLPHILQVEGPVNLDVFRNGLKENPINIPESLLSISKKITNNRFDEPFKKDFFSDRPVGFEIKRNRDFDFNNRKDTLFRHNGYYGPVFRTIPLFDIDNKNFKENLNNFGKIEEMIKSKVNENENLLRLKTNRFNSIFPQVDEIGYFVDSHNIFKSSFDLRYYKKTSLNK